jgi:hypothetical protein
MGAGSLPGMNEGVSVLFAGNIAYQYLAETQQVSARIELPVDEVLAGVSKVGESLAVLSDRAVYFFDGREFLAHDKVVPHRLRTELPGKMGDLSQIDLIELIDGYLIAYSFSDQAHNLEGSIPFQQIERLSNSGQSEMIARRTLQFDYGSLYRYRLWWTSPPLYFMYKKASGFFSSAELLASTDTPAVPKSMMWVAALLSTLATVIAIWRTGRIGVTPAVRLFWISACALVGVPALACLWLIYSCKQRFSRNTNNPGALQ